MYRATKKFIIQLDTYLSNNFELLKQISNKVSDELAYDILFSLQTKRIYLEKKYGLNPRTIDSIFIKANEFLPFNFKKVNRNNLY
jgi:hypothetical protein